MRGAGGIRALLGAAGGSLRTAASPPFRTPSLPPRCSLVRRIRYVPMLVWGWLGTALPHQVRRRQAPALAHERPATGSTCRRSWPALFASPLLPALQIPLTVVVGKPIAVPQRDNPSAEEVRCAAAAPARRAAPNHVAALRPCSPQPQPPLLARTLPTRTHWHTQVQAYLQRFIEAVEDIFRRHQAAAGYADATLTVL